MIEQDPSPRVGSRARVANKRSRYQTILTKQQDMRVLHRQLREDDAIPQAVRQLTNRCRLMGARETEPAELLPPCLSQRSANRLITEDCVASRSRERRAPRWRLTRYATVWSRSSEKQWTKATYHDILLRVLLVKEALEVLDRALVVWQLVRTVGKLSQKGYTAKVQRSRGRGTASSAASTRDG